MHGATQSGCELVIGVDPGLTTGIVAIHPGTSRAWSGQVMAPYVMETVRSIIRHFEDDALHRDSIVLAVEKFEITARTARVTRQPHAQQLIGSLCALADQGLHILMMVSPSQKSLVENPYLRKLGLYIAGKPHANDAARNAVITLLNLNPEVILSWLEGATIDRTDLSLFTTNEH